MEILVTIVKDRKVQCNNAMFYHVLKTTTEPNSRIAHPFFFAELFMYSESLFVTNSLSRVSNAREISRSDLVPLKKKNDVMSFPV